MTRNQIDYMKYKEEQRHNYATEGETSRSNRAQEDLTRSRDVGTLRLRQLELDESKRHNMAGELINLKTNEKVTNETERHNRASEELGLKSNEVAGQNAAAALINAGANAQNANTRRDELTSLDAYRNDQINLGMSQLSETSRHNQATEQIQTSVAGTQGVIANAAYMQALIAQQNANTRQDELSESQRHNQQTETNSRVSNAINLFGAAARAGLLY